ncbi:MAG TPA: N-6 DNA methylase, partial [Paludibacteraceae bacterium]|nr:N-6 DNA methylase [Paludibacteraceae bacterium]
MRTHAQSKQRIAQYGEVLTPTHIVDAMLDLVKQETERIDSRFLEPACGTGNFLVEILHIIVINIAKSIKVSAMI